MSASKAFRVPACAAPWVVWGGFLTLVLKPPSSGVLAGWREMDGRAPRHQGHQEALDRLLFLTKEAHRHCSCHGTCTPQPPDPPLGSGPPSTRPLPSW